MLEFAGRLGLCGPKTQAIVGLDLGTPHAGKVLVWVIATAISIGGVAFCRLPEGFP